MNKKYMDKAEALGMEGMDRMQAFFDYEGNDPKIFQKARLGFGAASSYSRLYATQTNRMAILQNERKLRALPAAPAVIENE
jgi:hypothetical protein